MKNQYRRKKIDKKLSSFISNKGQQKQILQTVIWLEKTNQTKMENTQYVDYLKKIKRKWAFSELVRRLRALSPSQYNKSSKFKQEWQKQKQQYTDIKQQQQQYLLHFTNKLYLFLESTSLLLNVIMIWYFTILITFKCPKFQYIQIPWKIHLFIEIIINLNTVKVINNKLILNRKKIFKQYLHNEAYLDVISLSYFIIDAIPLLKIHQNYSILTLIIIFNIIIKINLNYKKIKPLIDKKIKKQYFTLINSFIFLFIMAHFFAIIMFASSEININKNWVLAIGIQNQQWNVKYIYSLYWAFTTMVTVGYGDISPKNHYEVSIIIFIQILGTSIFGYMINIIGITLNQLKKDDQIYQKQLKISQKIAECFQLDQQLTYRLKMNISDNKKVDQSFSLMEQKLVLDKVHPQLRDQILAQTNTKVIKKCLFFLSNFTRNFIDQVSIKLIKKILLPSQNLLLTNGEEGIYIIHKGNVQIHLMKRHNTKSITKIVRQIKTQTQRQIRCNVYGYSSLITGRQLNLLATSSQFSIAYKLNKSDFFQILQKYPSDYETVCELRDKYNRNYFLQEIQAPQLKDSNQHIIINKLLTIKKQQKQQKQTRCLKRRHHRKLISDIYEQIQSYRMLPQIIGKSEKRIQDSLRKSVEGENKSYEQQMIVNKQHEIILDSIKTYTHYFCNFNVSNVLNKYKKLRKY